MAKPLCNGFRINAVVSGARFGVLIGKQSSPAQRTTWAYFYPLDPTGLPPNEQVIRLCRDQIYSLRPSNDERAVLTLLKRCAEYCEGKGGLPRSLPERDVFKSREGYTRVIPRFFDQKRGGSDSDLRRYIGLLGSFKANILDRERKSKELLVTAAEFLVLLPHEVMPHEELKYLQHVTQVLEFDRSNDSPQWFRKTGPRAIDFREKTVFMCQERVHELRKLALSNPFSLLQGEPASGKSVLARTLAFELYKENPRIYFFRHRDFNVDELAQIINSVRGLVIMEDIHRNIREYQSLYSLLRPHPERHVLFVTRSHFRHFQDLIDYVDLGDLPSMATHTSDNKRQIIEAYLRDQKVSHAPWYSVLEKVEYLSHGNLWLLAYALRGYCKDSEAGQPLRWLKEGIMDDLRSLRNCGDPSHDVYPYILLALSPLYKHEIMTGESFLVDELGFSRHVLMALTRRGEIARQVDTQGNASYGLWHSALADAYWEHGREYRKGLPREEDFVYHYLLTQPPSWTIDVLGNLYGETGASVRLRFHEEKRSVGLLENGSIHDAFMWIYNCHGWETEEVCLKDGLFRLLAGIIERGKSLTEVGALVRQVYWSSRLVLGRKLKSMVRWQALKDRFDRSDNVEDAVTCLFFLSDADAHLAREVWHTVIDEGILIDGLCKVEAEKVDGVLHELRSVFMRSLEQHEIDRCAHAIRSRVSELKEARHPPVEEAQSALLEFCRVVESMQNVPRSEEEIQESYRWKEQYWG